MTNISPLLTTTVHHAAKSSASANDVIAVERSRPKLVYPNDVVFSALARQLNESEVRAKTRDTALSFKDLGTLAKNIIDKIAGSGFYANRELHDAEVPDTDDPALLERSAVQHQYVKLAVHRHHREAGGEVLLGHFAETVLLIKAVCGEKFVGGAEKDLVQALNAGVFD